MKESITINSDASLVAFQRQVEQQYIEHRYLTFSPPRIGKDRSIDQNSLFHVWATEFAAYLLDKDKKQVTKGELEGMKFEIKKRFTRQHPHYYHWMVHEVVNPATKERKKGYTSSASWKPGEMFTVLNWLQMYAADRGLILESKGKHAKLQREHEGLINAV